MPESLYPTLVSCFFNSTVHLISPLVENLSREGIKTHSRLSALSVGALVPRWMLVECMKNKYWLGHLPQSRLRTEFEKGLMASMVTVQPLTVSSIHYGKVLKGSLVKSHNEAITLFHWLTASDQLLSLGLLWTCIDMCTMNRKQWKPEVAPLVI